jgi:hypothetical protein
VTGYNGLEICSWSSIRQGVGETSFTHGIVGVSDGPVLRQEDAEAPYSFGRGYVGVQLGSFNLRRARLWIRDPKTLRNQRAKRQISPRYTVHIVIDAWQLDFDSTCSCITPKLETRGCLSQGRAYPNKTLAQTPSAKPKVPPQKLLVTPSLACRLQWCSASLPAA